MGGFQTFGDPVSCMGGALNSASKSDGVRGSKRRQNLSCDSLEGLNVPIEPWIEQHQFRNPKRDQLPCQPGYSLLGLV